MSRGTLIPITPSVLRWAIGESGYTDHQVADRIGVELTTLQSWEGEETKPNLTQFKKLAAFLHRPSATFLLPEPPKLEHPQIAFRHPPEAERTGLNPDEIRYVRETIRLQRALAWVSNELSQDLPELPRIQVGDDVQRVATETRSRLDITDELQSSWTSVSQALHTWRSAVEATGILVFSLPLGKGKVSCRGFSIWNEHAPVITVNSGWSYGARLFTLFHEYAHLLSRTSSACIEGGRRFRRSTDPIERWCERFAASVLMPWDPVLAYLEDRLHWSPGEVIEDIETPRRIANRFKVSLRAATIRLIEKRLATWELYSEIPASSDDKERGGPPGEGRDRGKRRSDEYGKRPGELLARAVHNDLVSHADAVSYLDIPSADMEAIERRIAS